MRAALVVTGVLGTGTVLVFAAAALVSALFPSGTLVPAGWNGGWGKGGWDNPGIEVPVPMPMPEPGIPEKGIVLPASGATVELAPAIASGTDDDPIARP